VPSLIRHPAPPDESWTYLLYAWGWGERQGLFGHKSRDGLRFERFSEQPLLSWGCFGARSTNDVVMTNWDRRQKRFVMYATILLPQAPTERTPWDNAPRLRRCIGRLESRDGVTWSEPELILAPDRNEPEWQQYYGMTVSEYEGLWIGFPRYYHLSWDFLRRGDELIFIYGGSTHREHTVRMEMALGVASLRRDGFVSLAPGGAEAVEAEIVTVPLAGAAGRGVILNTEPDWRHDSWFSVEAQTADGSSLKGYRFEDCGHVEDTGVACRMRWGTQTRLPADRGHLRLRIRLHRQRLYAIRFEE